MIQYNTIQYNTIQYNTIQYDIIDKTMKSQKRKKSISNEITDITKKLIAMINHSLIIV